MVSWDIVQRSKESGGLGVRNLKIANVSLLLKWLWQWKDQEPIKVVTGIRRCGKSTLLSMFQNQLRENGINDNQIIVINFEHPDFIELDNSIAVWKYLKPKIVKGRKVKGPNGDKDLPGLKTRVPSGLSAEMMDKILARSDEYLTFWP